MDAFLNAPAAVSGWDDSAAQPLPSEDEDLVPFSPQNRMKTFLVLAMLIDSIIVIGGVVWLQKYSPNATSTPLAFALIGFGGLGMKELLVMIHNHQEARQTRHDLRGAIGKTTEIVQVAAKGMEVAATELAQKTNGGLTNAVKEMGEQVRLAEREQLIADPKCREAIQEIVRQTVQELKGPPG